MMISILVHDILHGIFSKASFRLPSLPRPPGSSCHNPKQSDCNPADGSCVCIQSHIMPSRSVDTICMLVRKATRHGLSCLFTQALRQTGILPVPSFACPEALAINMLPQNIIAAQKGIIVISQSYHCPLQRCVLWAKGQAHA